MLGRTIALALLAAAAVLPASAAGTAYDRAASMAAGETALGRGYDGAGAAGAVKASVNNVPGGAALAAPEPRRISQTRTVLDAASITALYDASVPAPALTTGLEVAGAAVGAVALGSAGGPVGALIGGMLGFGIALMLSKLLT
ncbi:MAG: hypothetical protein A2V88_13830 [Elusimicrobia bacterium RBG_16_66_12]|nr:MAG: hypothetical protein A2V88_13830 [Elusimicrobia bacterium RBG_16_66_12]